MTNSYGPTGNTSDASTAPVRDDLRPEVEPEIDEADISVLGAYSWESDHETLVGLGPVRARARAERSVPRSERVMPPSEPPGPFVTEDTVPRSFRRKSWGIWGVALPALLLVAGAAFAVVHAMGPSRRSAAAASAAAAPDPSPPVKPPTATLAVRPNVGDAHVYLDGEDRGTASVLLLGLEPGSHALSIRAPGYLPFEQPVMLVADQVSTIEPVLVPVEEPTPSAAPATLPAPHASAVARPVPASSLAREATSTSRTPSPATALAATGSPTPLAPSSAQASTLAPAPSSSAAATAPGSLELTSTPPSNVVLDGRPLGKSPRTLAAAPGKHTVVFVHPTLGRQTVTVNVLPGRTTSATAEF